MVPEACCNQHVLIVLHQIICFHFPEMKKKYSEIETECLFWKEHRRSEEDVLPVHVVGGQWRNGSYHSGQTRRKLYRICERHSAQLHGDIDDDGAHVRENGLNMPKKCKKEERVTCSSPLDYGPFTESQHRYYICCKNSHSLR